MTPPLQGSVVRGPEHLLSIVYAKNKNMFKTVSWSAYLVAVLVILVIYYTVLLVLYYRRDVLQLLRQSIKRDAFKAPGPFSPTDAEKKNDPVLFSSVHELLEGFKELFFTAAQEGYPKEELVTALHAALKGYPHLKGSQLAPAIQTHIIQTAASICNIVLDENDMKRIW